MFTNPSLFHSREPPHEAWFPKFTTLFGEFHTNAEIATKDPFDQFYHSRTQYFHQQLYILFFICAIIFYFVGGFVKGLIILILIQVKALFVFIWRKLTQLYEKCISSMKTLTWAIGRRCCSKLLKKIEEDMVKKEQMKKIAEQKENIIDEIDKLWYIYDRDRSGSLEFAESRELVKDLLVEIGQSHVFTDALFEQMFELHDKNNSDSLEKGEICKFVEDLLTRYHYDQTNKFEQTRRGLNAMIQDVPSEDHMIYNHSKSSENEPERVEMSLRSEQFNEQNKDPSLPSIIHKQIEMEPYIDFPESPEQHIEENEEIKSQNLEEKLNQISPIRTRRSTYNQLAILEESQIQQDGENDVQISNPSQSIQKSLQLNLDKVHKDEQLEGGGPVTVEGKKMIQDIKEGLILGIQTDDGDLIKLEEKKHQEKIMAKFKRQTLQPYISEDILMEFNISNLKSMYKKAIKEEQDINHFFNIRSSSDAKIVLVPPINRRVKKHELRIIFEELCYTSKLLYPDVFLYLDQMRKRVKDVEKVIDHHFDLIKHTIYQSKVDKIERQNKKDSEQKDGKKKRELSAVEQVGLTARTNRSSRSSMASSARQSQSREEDLQTEFQKQIEMNIIKTKLANDPELQFNNPNIYSYEKKLEMVEAFEEDLLKNDRSRKENRSGIQTICRMQGSIIQSYFILDQYDFKVAKEIFYTNLVAGQDIHTSGNQKHPQTAQAMLQQKYGQIVGQVQDVIFEVEESEEREDMESFINKSYITSENREDHKQQELELSAKRSSMSSRISRPYLTQFKQ